MFMSRGISSNGIGRNESDPGSKKAKRAYNGHVYSVCAYKLYWYSHIQMLIWNNFPD